MIAEGQGPRDGSVNDPVVRIYKLLATDRENGPGVVLNALVDYQTYWKVKDIVCFGQTGFCC